MGPLWVAPSTSTSSQRHTLRTSIMLGKMFELALIELLAFVKSVQATSTTRAYAHKIGRRAGSFLSVMRTRDLPIAPQHIIYAQADLGHLW